ncbi:polysaccharide pyruvyl transferase family protein [Microbacterium foliorum]|uniref:Polysaccharide pyruvyl transferase family protein n=1 Tax=Microbacterium foliorum TaxID=104336 RepID=A0A4Y5YTE3_9MICO|nr:polysaccharide pyruvyl transferase family protein [Microbacterium foliorum]QDE35753.1 polysaccharide pyruvyl transferase family protein [Microbacterium foliorum]
MSLTGPAGNIGDALIRRETLAWAMGTSDELVAYTGDAPDVWLTQLGLPGDALVLRTKKSVPRWLRLLVLAPRRPVLVFEAGEIPLDRGNGLRELVFLVETLIVRVKGGVVVRPPRGIRAPSQPALAIHRLAARLSQVTLWRDESTLATARCGRLAPDIGFSAGARPGLPWGERSELLVSLRGARPLPDAEWLSAVRETAERAGLAIRTVVQVREDESRARELAQLLGGEFEPWGDTDPLAQEERLRHRYDAAQIVISDRMHVLVLAALSGAVPLELVPRPTMKITKAFEAIGLHGVSVDSSADDRTRMRAALLPTPERAAEVSERVRIAAATLEDIQHEIRDAVRRVRA